MWNFHKSLRKFLSCQGNNSYVIPSKHNIWNLNCSALFQFQTKSVHKLLKWRIFFTLVTVLKIIPCSYWSRKNTWDVLKTFPHSIYCIHIAQNFHHTVFKRHFFRTTDPYFITWLHCNANYRLKIGMWPSFPPINLYLIWTQSIYVHFVWIITHLFI